MVDPFRQVGTRPLSAKGARVGLLSMIGRHCTDRGISTMTRPRLIRRLVLLGVGERRHRAVSLIARRLAAHFGEPTPVSAVQLGGSLAGKLSSRLSSIMSLTLLSGGGRPTVPRRGLRLALNAGSGRVDLGAKAMRHSYHE
jgi:hypothetical protein